MKLRRITPFIVAAVIVFLGSARATAVESATYWPLSQDRTYLTWLASPDVAGYAVFVNGSPVPVEMSMPTEFADSGRIEANVEAMLGPADLVEIAALGSEGVVGTKSRAEYRAHGYIYLPELNLTFSDRLASLDPIDVAKLRTFAELAAEHGFTQLIAVGHDASATAGAPTPYRLGQLRARAAAGVIGRWVSVPVVVSSLGASSPVGSNATPEGRAANRRVELGLR